MTLPIQDEPESTVGRKPSRWPHDEPERTSAAPARPGAGLRREEADERSDAGAGLRDRERGDPPTVQGPEK
jgi:hypothetical protein